MSNAGEICVFEINQKNKEGMLMILAIPLEGDRFCDHFGGADQFVLYDT